MADVAMERLKAIPLFAAIPDRDLEFVQQRCRRERFLPGDELCREGLPGGRMFVILSGYAKVTVGGRPRRSAGPGSTIGELSIFDRGPRTATVRADTDVEALSLDEPSLLAIVREHPTIAVALLRTLASRLREANKSATA